MRARAIAAHPRAASSDRAAGVRGRPAQRGGRAAAGFADVTSADGDVRDLVRLVAARHADASAPLLYLAGEDRAGDLAGELAAHGIAAEMAVVYRAVTAPFPPDADRGAARPARSTACCIFPGAAPRIISPAPRQAGVAAQALGVRIICLSAQVAEPLQPRRRQPHRHRAAAGRGGADRTSGAAARLDWRRSRQLRYFLLAGGPIRRGIAMADKRTTPETPEGARQTRRRRRAARSARRRPSISPPPKCRRLQTAIRRRSPIRRRAGAAASRRAGRHGRSRGPAVAIGMATLAAGVAGAAVVMLVLFGALADRCCCRLRTRRRDR